MGRAHPTEGSAAHAEQLLTYRDLLADTNSVRRDWASVARSERIDVQAYETVVDAESRRSATFLADWGAELARATALATLVGTQAEAEGIAIAEARAEADRARADTQTALAAAQEAREEAMSSAAKITELQVQLEKAKEMSIGPVSSATPS